jgi:hypothetical protein
MEIELRIHIHLWLRLQVKGDHLKTKIIVFVWNFILPFEEKYNFNENLRIFWKVFFLCPPRLFFQEHNRYPMNKRYLLTFSIDWISNYFSTHYCFRNNVLKNRSWSLDPTNCYDYPVFLVSNKMQRFIDTCWVDHSHKKRRTDFTIETVLYRPRLKFVVMPLKKMSKFKKGGR